jgi:hypothetical protein
MSTPAPQMEQQLAAQQQGMDQGADVRPRLIPGSDQTEGEVPASQQDQAILEQVISKAMTMVHGRKSRDAVLNVLHNPKATVAEVVGKATTNILMTISDQKAAADGQPLDESTLQEAASYLVPELMTVGCAAGIFPFDAPNDDSEPGAGNKPFDTQVRLAMLEAVKAYGERELRKPTGQARSERAANEWARGVRDEVMGGTADPEFMKMARPTKLIMGEEDAAAQAQTQAQVDQAVAGA